MARAAWSGIVSLGLMNLPTQLIHFERGQDCAKLFDQQRERLHDEREKYKDADVPWLRKMRSGEYFQIQTQSKIPPPPVEHSVSLFTYLPAQDINALAVTETYAIVPTDAALHAFVLFADSLAESKRAQIGVVSMQKKARLCAIMPKDGVLCLYVLARAPELSLISEFAKRHISPHLLTLLDEFDRNSLSAAKITPEGSKRKQRGLKKVG